ncbi:hypothetical protein IJS98_02725 [bacterium]|nr:hypothetical protein [bacterium]
MKNGVNIYFSDFFDISEDVIEAYGAVNISLINDLPLFIDPFLLFNSEDEQLRAIHDEMISYLKFLQIQSEGNKEPTAGMLKAWYLFSEVKQTWLGFSLDGHAGRGLGRDFAYGLHRGLGSIFKSFGKETITKAPHMEKLCLISSNVGRDKISDFTTNFAKKYLLTYTEKFARENLDPSQCKDLTIPKVYFNYETRTWVPQKYYLPYFENDYVLLTPKCILTRDDTFINRSDMLRNLQTIAPSVDDETLRFELDQYLSSILGTGDKYPTKTEKDRAAEILLLKHPELIDYYVKYKEDHEKEATSVSKEQVSEVELMFQTQLTGLVDLLKNKTGFYETVPDAHEESLRRVKYLKQVIEDQDGYRFFYVNGKPVKRESDLQVMFRLTWYGTPLDVNREVNNGRGPVDYKISYGKKNSTLVEFKLASNSKLKQNLEKQVDVYKTASETDRAIKAILYFTDAEYEKVTKVLNDLNIIGCPDVILIDARNNNKPSASNVRS